jgi:hypothetical protein
MLAHERLDILRICRDEGPEAPTARPRRHCCSIPYVRNANAKFASIATG